MLNNLIGWMDSRLRFEHFAVLSLLFAVVPVLVGFDFDVDVGCLSGRGCMFLLVVCLFCLVCFMISLSCVVC